MEWTICGLTAQPGEKVQGYFAGPDGEKTIPDLPDRRDKAGQDGAAHSGSSCL